MYIWCRGTLKCAQLYATSIEFFFDHVQIIYWPALYVQVCVHCACICTLSQLSDPKLLNSQQINKYHLSKYTGLPIPSLLLGLAHPCTTTFNDHDIIIFSYFPSDWMTKARYIWSQWKKLPRESRSVYTVSDIYIYNIIYFFNFFPVVCTWVDSCHNHKQLPYGKTNSHVN